MSVYSLFSVTEPRGCREQKSTARPRTSPKTWSPSSTSSWQCITQDRNTLNDENFTNSFRISLSYKVVDVIYFGKQSTIWSM